MGDSENVISGTIDIDGQTWQVFPSGYITQYDQDEFGLLFVSGEGKDREVRVTRLAYSSPQLPHDVLDAIVV